MTLIVDKWNKNSYLVSYNICHFFLSGTETWNVIDIWWPKYTLSKISQKSSGFQEEKENIPSIFMVYLSFAYYSPLSLQKNSDKLLYFSWSSVKDKTFICWRTVSLSADNCCHFNFDFWKPLSIRTRDGCHLLNFIGILTGNRGCQFKLHDLMTN